MAENAPLGGERSPSIINAAEETENAPTTTGNAVLGAKKDALEPFAETAPQGEVSLLEIKDIRAWSVNAVHQRSRSGCGGCCVILEPLAGQESDDTHRGHLGSPAVPVPPLAFGASHARQTHVTQQGADYKTNVPQIFVKVVKYYLRSSPPRQIRWVSECCNELLLYAMGTGDNDTPFSSSTREAVDQVCKENVHIVAEEHLATAAASSRVGYNRSGTIVLAKPLRIENVVGSHSGYSSPFWKWYAVLKDQAIVQVDPLRLRVISYAKVQNSPSPQVTDERNAIATWNRFLGEDESAKSRYLIEIREALERQIGLIYIPKHYPFPEAVGFSVHCLRSQEVANQFQFNITSDGSANVSVAQQNLGNCGTSADSSVSSAEGDNLGHITESDSQTKQSLKKSGKRPTLQIALSTEKENQCNFWSGGWSSLWDLFLTSWEQEDNQDKRPAKIEMRGEIRVRLHYTEDGSTFMRHTKTTTVVLPNRYESPEAAATAVLEAIEEKELAVVEDLYCFYDSLHSKILRSMRRVFALCGQTFDWSGAFRSITQDLAQKQREKCYEAL